MDKPVTFTEVAGKRGVLNTTQQIAKTVGSMASQLAKQKAKQDAADRAELKQMMAGVTKPSKLNKLLVQDAQKSFGETTMGLQKLYSSNDPQRSIKGQMLTNDYLEKVNGEYVAKSVNYNILEEESRKANLWRPKKAQKLVDQYTTATTEEQFVKMQQEDPTPEYFNIETRQVSLPLAKERIDTQKVLDNTVGEIKAIQVGPEKLTTVLLTEKEADDHFKLYGVRPNTIEQVVDASFMNNYDYLEQYVDNKDLAVGNVRSMSADERELVKKSLLEDAAKFRSLRYPNSTKIFLPGEKEDSTFTFVPNIALPQITIAKGNQNVTTLAPALGNIKPQGKQTYTINNFRGAVNRQGEPYKAAKLSEAELSSVSIRPYKIEKGVERVVIDYKEIKNATGFKVYYEFNGGDVSIPVSNEPNLQFNVGGKNAIAVQKDALQKQKALQMKVTEYHKKVKAGTIKNPLLYQKIQDVAENKISQDDYISWMETFNFDK